MATAVTAVMPSDRATLGIPAVAAAVIRVQAEATVAAAAEEVAAEPGMAGVTITASSAETEAKEQILK